VTRAAAVRRDLDPFFVTVSDQFKLVSDELQPPELCALREAPFAGAAAVKRPCRCTCHPRLAEAVARRAL
jgi:hypothetical protein